MSMKMEPMGNSLLSLWRGYGDAGELASPHLVITTGAVTSIQIDGVLHEFSTIPGVMEDVTEVILNLKALSLKKISRLRRGCYCW